MAGIGLKLINKLKRREKWAKRREKGFDQFDKSFESEERMARSSKAYQILVKIKRRLARSFGVDMVGDKPKISKKEKIQTVARYNFGISDYGIRLTMAPGLIADMHLAVGDVVRFLNGTLKGQYLNVVAIPDSTHLRLEDSLLLTYAGAKEQTQILTVSDVASSLNNTYFTIKSANDATSYYVWYDVGGAGVDPAPGGTGIPVAINVGANLNVVANATMGALNSVLGTPFSATAVGNVLIVTNTAVGVTTDAADFNTTFTISVLVQGANANPALSESNKVARFQLSDVKGTYR